MSLHVPLCDTCQPLLPCRGGGTAVGPTIPVPKVSFRGTSSPWLLLNGADTLLGLSSITPGASTGHVGPVSVSANSRQSEGQGRGHCSIFSSPYLRMMCPDMLGCYSAAAWWRDLGKGYGGQAGGARRHGLNSMHAAPLSPQHLQSISAAPVTDRLGASAAEQADDGLTPLCRGLTGFVHADIHAEFILCLCTFTWSPYNDLPQRGTQAPLGTTVSHHPMSSFAELRDPAGG